VGAGLVGSLLSTYLTRRDMRVEVWERRHDPRVSSVDGGRSINLVLTSRGIEALRHVGLEEIVLRHTVAVTGRMMHAVDGTLTFQPYGRDDSECNHSISRSALNRLLIDAAEERGVRFHFGKRMTEADLRQGRLSFADDTNGKDETVETDRVFGADGAYSAVRTTMQLLEGYHEAIEPLGHGYRELLIPAGENGSYRIEKHALHIWPRGHLMLMALPNLDGSFTATLYLPQEGSYGFRELNRPEKVMLLFERYFPDAIPLIPDLAQSFLANPAGHLGTVRCHPWHVEGRAVLIGDAAHAIVPFFGQGMNCGFEDCVVLDRLIDEHGEWEAVFAAFTHERKPHADAIADMALENFIEMRDLVGDTRFLLRKQVELRLERHWPGEYRSRYSMVMYGGVAYGVAQEAGRIQQEILDELCDGLASAEELDANRARRLIGEKLTPFLERHAVDLRY